VDALTLPSSLTITALFGGLLGGLALFLFGMERLSESLKAVAGVRMKNMLARMTSRPLRAAFAGAFVTAVVQSSSLTTVLVVGFVSSGLMTMQQSVGVIMGANVGTTVTAQVIAFNVGAWGLPLIAVGFAAEALSRRERAKRIGVMLMGLGLVFFGLELMSRTMQPLSSWQPFLEVLRRVDAPLIGIVAGAVFTALVQSSSATTGVAIALASQGLVTLEGGVALILGANIGTCITALLASAGRSREATQAAVVHVLFNVAGVVLWLPFLDQLVALSRQISPDALDAVSVAPRQIANAHTVFNVVNTFLFIGFSGWFARAAERLTPQRKAPPTPAFRTKYLQDVFLESPELALDAARHEIGRLGERAVAMLRGVPETLRFGSADELDRLQKMDDEVDALHEQILAYLARFARRRLPEDRVEEAYRLMSAAHYFENVADTVETNLVSLGRERLRRDLALGDAAWREIQPLFDAVCGSLEDTAAAITESDHDRALKVEANKERIETLSHSARRGLGRLMASKEPEVTTEVYRLGVDAVEYLKRIYYFSKRIARLVTRAA